MNSQEEEINLQEEKVSPQEEKMNLQEEKWTLSPGLPHVLKYQDFGQTGHQNTASYFYWFIILAFCYFNVNPDFLANKTFPFLITPWKE